jgi:predicted Ser/Thr protein kinase
MIMNGMKQAERLRRADPRELGGYRLLGRLGAGGMGVVFLARAADGRQVAVKMVHAHLAGDGEFRERFRSEVRRARQVPSFCTAEVLDADPDHNPPYLVVEYVDGPSLREEVERRGPLSPANVHAVAVGVASALTAIHGAGVIHRDLNPRNVLLAPGSPKVIDFGIARAFEGGTLLTRPGQMLGTVAYMAPERFDSRPHISVDPAADIFAWGVVAAYAATGRTPFEGGSPHAMADRILTKPANLNGLPEPLGALVGHTLAKDPADRPTARELLDLLLTGGPRRSPVPAQVMPGRPAARLSADRARPMGRTPVAVLDAPVGPERWQTDAGRDVPPFAPPARRPFSPPPPPVGRTVGPAAHARRRGQNRPVAIQVSALLLTVTALVVGGIATVIHRPLAQASVRSAPSVLSAPVTPDRTIVRSALNDKCLDVGDRNGPVVLMSACAGAARQVWNLADDGTVRSGGRCLSIERASTADGALVGLAGCTGSTGQRWRYTAGRDLVNPRADKCLDIRDRATSDGARLQLWSCAGTSNQKWALPG